MSWTIERTPGRPLHRTTDDCLALPLRLSYDGGNTTDTELLLSRTDAEHLHAALCRALDGQPTPMNAPGCRRSVQTSPSNSHVVGRA